MSLKYIYEHTIASRPAMQQLLNEITNSPANVNRFYDVYCPWFVLGPSWTSVTNWRWSWPQGTGTIINEVPEYEKMVKDKKYPTPRLIYVTGPAEKARDFKRVLMHSMHVPVLNKAEEYLNRYKLLLESLLEKFKERYPLAAITVERAISENSIWTIETERFPEERPKEQSYKVRYKLNDFIVHFILILFAFKQKNLPQRDIFKYGNVLDILEVLHTTVSNRQKKSTAQAAIKKEIPGLIYQDDKVLVVEPPTWEFSRRYFGAPERHSLIDDTKIIKGATWCTSASSYQHWDRYVEHYKNHLYYFVDKNTEELHAIRTAGGGDVDTGDLNKIYARLNYFVFTTEHAATIAKCVRNDLLAKPQEVTAFHQKILLGYLTKFEVDVPGLMQTITHFRDDDYQAYTEYFTLEARDQENKLISMQSIFDKYGLDLNWVKKHLKFVDYLD